MAETPTPTWKIAGVVGFYMTVALIMVMVNKSVLTHSDLPMTFLFLQLSVSVVLLHTWAAFTNDSSTSTFRFSRPTWSVSALIAMAPLCLVNIVGLVFNILCLQIVDASYFQVARGLTLPMTIALQSFMEQRRPTRYTIISCALVSYGFGHSFLQSRIDAPAFGMVLGALSAAMVTVHAILIRSVLRHVEGRTLDLAYWQNTLGAIALIPAVVYEVPKMVDADMSTFLTGSAVTGVTGFLICVAGLLSIKVTSPVTHMFSAAVRSVLQTALGVYLFGDVLNSSRIVSITLISAGSLFYTYAKSFLEVASTVVVSEKSKA